MAIVVHVVATAPGADVREAYQAIWERFATQGIRHPTGRRSHLAYLVGDAVHTADVWESREDLERYLQKFAPIAEELGIRLEGPPEVGELLAIVMPPG